jgi:carbon-monoxide dehydrogenase large subunit
MNATADANKIVLRVRVITGQLLTGTFMDYYMPRADCLPTLSLHDRSIPSPSNPLGAKGAGEAGTTGAIPTIANAVMDALAPLGIHKLDLPYTPHRIWAAIQRARQSQPDGDPRTSSSAK